MLVKARSDPELKTVRKSTCSLLVGWIVSKGEIKVAFHDSGAGYTQVLVCSRRGDLGNEGTMKREAKLHDTILEENQHISNIHDTLFWVAQRSQLPLLYELPRVVLPGPFNN